MANVPLHRIKTISEYHHLMGLPKPEHPLISVIDLAKLDRPVNEGPMNMIFGFYSISLKKDFNAKMKYGQQEYDFDEGTMFFISPGQVFGIEVEKGTPLYRSGWILLVHPDFLWNTPLAKNIKQYDFFDYSVKEALFLSEKEELIIINMMQNIQQEYHSNIDKYTQDVMIAQLDLMLTYGKRFYERQFITRKISNHQMLSRLEDQLSSYFNSDQIIKNGLPTVTYIAEKLNVSPGYLGSLLKVLTGQNTQQHIHAKLIAKAKEKLSTTNLSVSEIAYELGFGHPQSFSKLFKTKTSFSPLEFRHSFN
jgi:AraC family transcriptional activator of pobA